MNKNTKHLSKLPANNRELWQLIKTYKIKVLVTETPTICSTYKVTIERDWEAGLNNISVSLYEKHCTSEVDKTAKVIELALVLAIENAILQGFYTTLPDGRLLLKPNPYTKEVLITLVKLSTEILIANFQNYMEKAMRKAENKMTKAFTKLLTISVQEKLQLKINLDKEFSKSRARLFTAIDAVTINTSNYVIPDEDTKLQTK